MTFNQFYDRINGRPYEDAEAPFLPRFLDYVKTVTSSPVNGTENGTSEFRLMTNDDMGRYAADDVVAQYAGQPGKMMVNTTKLGPPMSDE